MTEMAGIPPQPEQMPGSLGPRDPRPGGDHTEPSLMGLIRVVYRWRRIAIGLALGLPLITALILLAVPNVYTASGTILLEVSDSGSSTALLGQISALAGLPTTQTRSAEVYQAILRSRRVGAAVAESLHLADHFGIKGRTPEHRMQNTLVVMEKRVRFVTKGAATLHIQATDRDAEMAAVIVNSFLDHLVDANQSMSLSRARRTRRQVEGALQQTGLELEVARNRMGDFQRQYGVFSLDDQTRGTLDLIADLQGQLLKTQTRQDALGGLYQESSTELRNLDHVITALKSRISKLVGTLGTNSGEVKGVVWQTPAEGDGEGFFLPLSQVPELSGQYARILMDLKVLETKYTVLATHLEQTKIEESQSLPTFEILDRAETPFRKSGPNRRLYVFAALMAGLLAGILLPVLLEDAARHLDEATQQELIGMLPAPLVARLLRRTRGDDAITARRP